MSAFVGLLLVIASIALFAWAVLLFRDPHGPAWRDRYLVLETVACLIVGGFVFGLAMQIQYALQFPGLPGAAMTLGAIAIAVIAYFVVWRLFGVAAKVSRFDEAERAPLRPKRA
jgi:hypothetical protein